MTKEYFELIDENGVRLTIRVTDDIYLMSSAILLRFRERGTGISPSTWESLKNLCENLEQNKLPNTLSVSTPDTFYAHKISDDDHRRGLIIQHDNEIKNLRLVLYASGQSVSFVVSPEKNPTLFECVTRRTQEEDKATLMEMSFEERLKRPRPQAPGLIEAIARDRRDYPINERYDFPTPNGVTLSPK
ncbi:MAG TPA: hypothetical protein VIN59_09270 [Alphaproteobacteria bacterium]